MILLVNGPNLNLLGEREPDVYGHETLADVERMVTETCAAYGVEVKSFQSNWEGALLDFLQLHRREAQGVILNPGALTHTSRALPDCLRALPCPTIEVHISNVHAREAWRHQSFVAPAAQGQIVGLGIAGYYFAALHLCAQLAARASRAAAGAEASSAPAPEERAEREEREEPHREPRLDAGTATGAPQPPPGGTGAGDLLDEPSEQIPVDQMARGEYEPL